VAVGFPVALVIAEELVLTFDTSFVPLSKVTTGLSDSL